MKNLSLGDTGFTRDGNLAFAAAESGTVLLFGITYKFTALGVILAVFQRDGVGRAVYDAFSAHGAIFIEIIIASLCWTMLVVSDYAGKASGNSTTGNYPFG